LCLAVSGQRGARRDSPDYLLQQVTRSWDKEVRNLDWFGLRDGMAIVDLGCGPCYFAERLADRLPSARITAVDALPTMLERVRERLGDRFTLRRARAEETGLPSDSFDFAIARLLLQHLTNPALALREAHRILKPGGKLVIIDVDDELFGLVEPPVPGLDQLLTKGGEAQASRGGNRHIGRWLVQLLQDAGFTELQFEIIAIHSTQAGLAATFPQLDPAALDYLVQVGTLSPAEHAALSAARQEFMAAENPLAITLLLMACGGKPTGAPAPRPPG